MPTPSRTHLPIKQFIVESQILDDEQTQINNNEADPTLLRLPSPSLRGTFLKAYNLLTKLVSVIGWDELLKCRSHVFVMEEEYRMQKAQAEVDEIDRGKVVDGKDFENGDDKASIRALKSSAEVNDRSSRVGDDNESEIPTIKISNDEDTPKEEGEDGVGKIQDESTSSKIDAEVPELVKPSATHHDSSEKEDEKAIAEDEEVQGIGIAKKVNGKPANNDLSFSNKRLCERWLDNLFMVLYEVRIYHNQVEVNNVIF
jgi:Chs5-Arf1p-binding protein BUD7/BCH1